MLEWIGTLDRAGTTMLWRDCVSKNGGFNVARCIRAMRHWLFSDTRYHCEADEATDQVHRQVLC